MRRRHDPGAQSDRVPKPPRPGAHMNRQFRTDPIGGERSLAEFVLELWAFMKARKKFWLLPIVLVLALVGTLLVLTQGSAVAPFIYTLF